MGQENKPDNFCLAEKRSKALGDGALYLKIMVIHRYPCVMFCYPHVMDCEFQRGKTCDIVIMYQRI